MARAAAGLLEATERDDHDGENRLTEILAAVLQGAPAFAERLMHDLGLPTGASYEVSTQVHAEGKFVDMEVLSLDERQRVRGRLWAEHKIYAAFGYRQMENYLARLATRPAKKRALVGIVREFDSHEIDLKPQPTTATPTGSSWRTWQQIAVLADDVARQRDGRHWRSEALAPDSPASQLLLLELVTALERRELAHMEPLEAIDVSTLQQAEEARDKLEALFERTLEYLATTKHFAPLPAKGHSGRSNREIGWNFHHLKTPRCWATTRYGGWAELITFSRDYWIPDSVKTDVPCLGAGFTFEANRARDLAESETFDRWRSRLARSGVHVGIDGKWVRCFAPVYLTEVVTVGQTLDDQAKYTAKRAEHAVAAIVAANPATKTKPAHLAD